MSRVFSRYRWGRRSPMGLILLILLMSLCLGWGFSQAIAQTPDTAGGVETVEAPYRLGQEFYLEACATCHLGIPPAVLPTQTWKTLLQDAQHYGVMLEPLRDPKQLLVWNYLRLYSRPIAQDEAIPYRIQASRYFKALHPKVDLPPSVKLSSCVSCHPQATGFDFRTLSGEWP